MDTGGDAVERYLYDPYGVATIYDGAWSSTRSSSSYDNTTLYTGRRYDPETGLYYYRARYYHAGLGRFSRRDPVGYFEGVGLYLAYFVPNQTDPTGAALVEHRQITFGCTCNDGQFLSLTVTLTQFKYAIEFCEAMIYLDSQSACVVACIAPRAVRKLLFVANTAASIPPICCGVITP